MGQRCSRRFATKTYCKKVRGKKFEIYDAKKFEEFAGSKKLANTWVKTSEDRDVPRKGFESSTVVPSPNSSLTVTEIEQRIKFEKAKETHERIQRLRKQY